MGHLGKVVRSVPRDVISGGDNVGLAVDLMVDVTRVVRLVARGGNPMKLLDRVSYRGRYLGRSS